MGRPVLASIKDRDLVRERREQLVAAAIAVFVRKGYHLATVRDIGREAGFTQGTIYNYVRSKGDILYLVCDEVVTAYQAAVHKAMEGIADPAARLRAALRAIVEVMVDRQEQILLLYHESHSLDTKAIHAILGRVEEFIRSFEDMLGALQRDLRLPLRDRRLAANIVTFLPTIAALRRWDLDRRVARADIVAGLVEFMLRGLGLDPAATVPGDGARRHRTRTLHRSSSRQTGGRP
ncbi:MAG: TetR/AcrR family transcriptional regulator [Candidatus Rokuibacteriota bacterium]